MRRTSVGLVLVLLAATLAGCMDGGSDEAGEDGDGREVDLGVVAMPWGLDSCRASWWLAPASSGSLREHLPEGFEPAEMPQLPGIDVLAGLDTYLGFDAFVCQWGTGLNGTSETITFGSLFTRVIPPDEYRLEGLDDPYFFRWEVLVPDPPRHDRFKELGLPARMGDAEIEAQTQTGSPGPWQNTLELDGLGTFTLTGSTTDAETPGDDVPNAAFTPAWSQIATWQATATNLTAALGWGVWTAEPGSWVADVLGSELGVAVFSVGHGSIAKASIRIPVPLDAGDAR